VSLIPSWLRRGATITTSELASRVKRIGSKGLPPLEIRDGILQTVQLLDLNDPAFTDNPTFIIAAQSVTAAAAQFPSVGLVGGAPRTIIDSFIVTMSATGSIMSRYSAQSVGQLGFGVSRDAVNQQPLKSLSSTVTNSLVALPPLPDRVHLVRALADTAVVLDGKVRLAQGQMLEVIGGIAQAQLVVTFYCREFQE
jgi:hypothetical protein